MRLSVRLLAGFLITGFWVLMWALLIRSELQPETTGLHVLPVELVLKQFFDHEQPSDLYLHETGVAVGRLRVEPSHLPDGSQLHLTGSLQIALPQLPAQRVSWDGQLTLDRQLNARTLQGSYNSRAVREGTVPPVRLDFAADSSTRQGWYQYRSGDTLVAAQAITLDQAGLLEVLRPWGIDPALVSQLSPVAAGSSEAPEVTARQTKFTVREVQAEPVDAVLLTVKLHGQTWLEIYLSQIGQVLQVKTLWGWILEGQ